MGGKCCTQTKKNYAVFMSDESKMLRCAPQSGTLYVPGCQVLKGSVVEVLGRGGNDKYAMVRIHGMLGYIRKRHLVPIPPDDVSTQTQRRVAIVTALALARKGVHGACLAAVIEGICREIVPWWLLPGQGESPKEAFCTKMILNTKRSHTAAVSVSRRKELAKSLNAWKAAFSKRHGRGPHALDIWTDTTVAAMYSEYESIGQARQKERRNGLTEKEHQRRKALCKRLKKWMSNYEEEHKRIPSKKRILGDPEIADIYREYLDISEKQSKNLGITGVTRLVRVESHTPPPPAPASPRSNCAEDDDNPEGKLPAETASTESVSPPPNPESAISLNAVAVSV